MSDLPIERKRLLNVAKAQAWTDTACELLLQAKILMDGEMATGLPIDTAALADALKRSRVASETIWIFLKRMP